MKIFFTSILLLFGIAIFGQTDAKVEAVYSLGQVPSPLGVYNHVISAKIINLGTTQISDLPVSLVVSGANSFSNAKTINIAPQDTTIVEFNSFSPWNQGTNTITVSIPDDEDDSNNSAVYTQLVNDRTFSYADNSNSITAAGFGSTSGILLTKYSVSGSAVVKKVKVHIGDQPSNEGNNIYAVVMQYGSIIATTVPHLITNAELGADVSFEFDSPVAVESEFMVGIGQNANAVPYYPVGVQDEGVKSRPNAYYASFADGSGLSDVTTIGRPMIEAEVGIGDQLPFNIPQQANYVIAAWDFTGINSPASTAATFIDTIVNSAPLLTRGTGATAFPGNDGFLTNGFGEDGIAVTNNDYFEFSITPKPGDTLALREIDGFVGNNTHVQVPGVSSQFAYSTDGINFTLIGVPLTNSTDGIGFYLGNIAALQNIPGGNTITFRYYASGPAASADWGFISTQPGKFGLSVTGRSVFSNKVITSPVIPNGADFVLSDCLVSPGGSINFTSTGNFLPGNQYKVELGKMYQPGPNNYLFLDPVVVGTLNSYDNSGTINFSIPAGTATDYYVLRISSTQPPVIGTYSQGFTINAPQCHSLATDRFRTKISGDWSSPSTWQSSSDNGNTWIDATLAPDDFSNQVEIADGHTIDISSMVSSNKTTVKGTLRIRNGNGNNGSFRLSNHVFGMPFLKIEKTGVLQFIANDGTMNDVLSQTGFITVAGKVIVGDGSTAVSAGFDGFAKGDYSVFWQNGSVFEWNSESGIAPSGDGIYFPDVFSVPTLKLTAIPSNAFGTENSLLVNGLLEVNNTISLTGTGSKTFRDGILGSGILTQDVSSGKIIVNSGYADFPAGNTTNATAQGIISGTVAIHLNAEGMQLDGGVTVPGNSSPVIDGKCIALQTVHIAPNAQLALLSDTLTLQDADLTNDGTISGSGIIQFMGSNVSLLSSAGQTLSEVMLTHKQLQLAGDSHLKNTSLSQESNLVLSQYNLFLDDASLIADSVNFIVTNDTGRLIRYASSSPVLYPVGIRSDSYTPVTVTNSGNAANVKVRVMESVTGNVPETEGNVNRTWLIGDTLQAGLNLSLQMRWNETDEQANFDRSRCYVSKFSPCVVNCSGGYFDAFPANASQGNTYHTIERSSIENFSYPSFIVTSKPFVYTFNGNGNWEDAANWLNGEIAPVTIPEGTEVSIDPIASGECLRNGSLTVKQGSKFTVQPGKKITITGDFNIE
ncbi:MAG: hypothetical protein JST81_01620 [Bacteroidetes bacterium]|nr:hypothetical protein [Bacteroidota bacterium]